MRALGVILFLALFSSATRADDLPPGHERWVGAAGSRLVPRLVDVRDLRPAVKAELERLLEQAGYERATASGTLPGMRRDLQVLVENQGRFPKGYRPKAAGLPGEASPSTHDSAGAAWLAEREAAVAAARFERRLLRAFGRGKAQHQLPAPSHRRKAVTGPTGR